MAARHEERECSAARAPARTLVRSLVALTLARAARARRGRCVCGAASGASCPTDSPRAWRSRRRRGPWSRAGARHRPRAGPARRRGETRRARAVRVVPACARSRPPRAPRLPARRRRPVTRAREGLTCRTSQSARSRWARAAPAVTTRPASTSICDSSSFTRGKRAGGVVHAGLVRAAHRAERVLHRRRLRQRRRPTCWGRSCPAERERPLRVVPSQDAAGVACRDHVVGDVLRDHAARADHDA